MRDTPAVLEELRALYAQQNKGNKKKETKKKAGGPVRIDPAKMPVIKPQVLATPKGDVEKFARLLETLTAQTDCGACGYPTCYEYTTAMAAGKDYDPSKCEPGGNEATADLGYAMDVYWKGPDQADAVALGAVPAEGAPPVAGDGAVPPAAAPSPPPG